MPSKKGGRLTQLINWRVKLTIDDGRNLIGQLLAFDKHMNLVVENCDEFRTVKSKKKSDNKVHDEPLEQKRSLGLTIVRGDTIVTLTVEGPPPASTDEKGPSLARGPGRAAPAGRGMGMGPPGIRGAPTSFVPPGARPPSFPPNMPPPPPGFQGGMPPGAPPGMQPPPGFMPPPGFRPQ